MFITISMLLGGLALFMYGMGAMTDGLRSFAESRLRVILSKATRHRAQGIALGTALGVLIHSSATTVMIVGFANAGLITLAQAVPPVMGANLGSSLSMQLVSLRLTDFAYAAIAIGVLMRLTCTSNRYGHLGTAIMGFGLLFLGMKTMGDAIVPHRAAIQPYLAQIDARTLQGMALGLLAATLATVVLQSSGATIGMCFVLIQAGAFTELRQIYPIILGAHLGTCTTALMAAIGTNLVARRCAAAHLLFNVFNVTMALVAAPLFLWAVPLTAGDLVHQAANLHTGVMLVAALAMLPFTRQFAAVIERLVGRGQPLPEPSYLDPANLATPETAIAAAIKELRRVARVCEKSLELNKHVFFFGSRQHVRQIRLNEEVIDSVKDEMQDYLERMTLRYLSRRQTLLIAHLRQCINHLERIGDHLEAVCDVSLRRRAALKAAFDQDTLEKLFILVRDIRRILILLSESFEADTGITRRNAAAILEARSTFESHFATVTEFYTERVASHQFRPVVGVYFGEYLGLFRRLVQHAQAIATYERSPDFWIKQSKLDQFARDLDPGRTISVENAERFLRPDDGLPAEGDEPPPMTDT